MSYSPFPPAFTTPGAGNPTDLIVVGGSDGTDARSLRTDTSGRILVQQPDQVLQATVAVTPAATAVTKTNTATVNGLGVAVTIANIDTAQYTANVSVKVVNATTGVYAHWQSCGLLWNGSDVTLFFNLPIAISDSIVISVISPATQTTNKTNVTAVVTALPMAVNLRPDGRSMPLLSQQSRGFANPATANSLITLIAAPAAGFRILLGGAILSAVGSASGPSLPRLGGTLNGASSDVMSLFLPGSSSVEQSDVLAFPQGILFDPATLVYYAADITGTSVVVVALYDVVPL